MIRGGLLKQEKHRTIVSRIWDLRRGDHQDNRTSPYVHSFRGLILSAALEFNYLKAALSFLALILAPALLLGVAPSVVATYGRMMFHAVTSVGSRPISGLLMLAVLLGIALWLGRPLLRMAVNNFWHLHYTLVFPFFVTVREVLRAIAEHLPGRALAPEQIDRRRRLGTVLAALLLVGGGVALAMTVEFSLGLQLVDVEHVRPLAVLRAALLNAAVVLGLSTAFESLYWLWRELSLSPVLDWAPNLPKDQSPVARVAHLSDLHLVGERYGYRMEAGTHGPQSNRRVRNALRKLAALHALAPLDHILVTGDVTDAGTRAEWAEFIDLLRGYPELRSRLSFVPGNHDVNIVDRSDAGRIDLPWSAGESLRKLRVVQALDSLQGPRAHLIDHASGALGPSLKDYLRDGERPGLLRALAKNGSLRGRSEMSKVWDALFPLVEPPTENDGCGYGLILLDSNSRSHFSLTNAVGVVNPSQLRGLKSFLQNSAGRAWIILLHHQLAEYPLAATSLRDRIGLALINAPDVLAALTPHASRVLVLHGHRHRDWLGTCGGVVLCSAPSVTLGSHEGGTHHGTFHVHELALGPGGGIKLLTTEHVNIA
jgi:3',5'-cyclic AMP phosphodiesterase CpdA